jgi:peptidoglycan/LPS O-acetylase OafA/YrhL
MGYVPALDGIRAIAIALVTLYHAEAGPFDGGFIGVDVFFVVSGFLITALLIEEFDFSGTISYRQFLYRRARRLLPALLVLLTVVSLWTSFFAPINLDQLRSDLLPAIGYISNWWQIFVTDIPYFAPDNPPLLRHLWSLAVEEQWYIVWPLCFLILKRWKKQVLLVCVSLCVIAVAISLAVAMLYDKSDPTRNNFLYLATPTRSVGLLLGAGLAMVWSPWKLVGREAATRHAGQLSNRRLSFVGVASFIALIVLSFALTVDGALYYRGGSFAVAVLSTALVASAVHPNAVFIHNFFRQSWLVAIGRRSYGIYLWHWPIFVFADVRGSTSGLAWALFVTAVCSEVSFRLIEQPILRGAIGRTWQQISTHQWRHRQPLTILLSTGISIALIASASFAVITTESVTIAKDTTHPDEVFTPSSLPSVVAAKADIALVMIGAWEVMTLKTKGRYYVFNSPEADALFLSQLQKGINALTEKGVHVALLEVPCMRPRQVEGQGTRPLPERRSDDRTSHLSDLLRRAATANASTTTFIEGPNEWCESSEIADNPAYRWDGVHVWKQGANLILETISGSVLSIPVTAK